MACFRCAAAIDAEHLLGIEVKYKTHSFYGHVGLEFKLRPFSAGSILTLRKRIEPLASTTSIERTPRKMQTTKLTPSITAPGKPQRIQRKQKAVSSKQKAISRCGKAGPESLQA